MKNEIRRCPNYGVSTVITFST